MATETPWLREAFASRSQNQMSGQGKLEAPTVAQVVRQLAEAFGVEGVEVSHLPRLQVFHVERVTSSRPRDKSSGSCSAYVSRLTPEFKASNLKHQEGFHFGASSA